jgi:hypothetical protein
MSRVEFGNMALIVKVDEEITSPKKRLSNARKLVFRLRCKHTLHVQLVCQDRTSTHCVLFNLSDDIAWLGWGIEDETLFRVDGRWLRLSRLLYLFFLVLTTFILSSNG